MRINEILELLPKGEQIPFSKDVEKYFSYENDTFYIAPNFTEIETEADEVRLILFSAPGATGKTALARYISSEKNAICWNTSGIQIGDGSFTGILFKAFGLSKTTDYISDLSNGRKTLVLDAFDEAEVRSGRESIKKFIIEIFENISKLEYPGKASIVMLSRTDTANYIKLVCNENNIPILHYEIGFFDEKESKDFIEKKIRKDSSSLDNKTVSECIDEYYRIVSELTNQDNKSSFLGYAPVLEAIAKHIGSPLSDSGSKSSNIKAFLENLKSHNSYDFIIDSIMDELINREHLKLITQLKERFADKNPQYTGWDDLYSKDAQLAIVLHYTLFNELEMDYLNLESLPSTIQDECKNAIESFLPQHPFITNKSDRNGSTEGTIDFTGPAFRDYTLARLLHSKEFVEIAEAYLDDTESHSAFPSKVFYDSYLQFSDKKNDTYLIPENHVAYLYEAFIAKASANEEIFLNVSEEEVGCSAEFILKNCKNNSTKDTVVEIEKNKSLLSFWKLCNVNIYAPSYDLKVGKQGQETSIRNSTILVNRVIWAETKQKLSFLVDRDSECSVIAVSGFEGNLEKIALYPDLGINLSISNYGLSGYAYNKLKKYLVEYSPDSSEEELKFWHVLSTILRTFKIDKKDTLAKSKDKIDFVIVGNNKFKKRVLDFLVAMQIVYVDPFEKHLYKANLSELDEYGINFSALKECNCNKKIYNKYCEWSKR